MPSDEHLNQLRQQRALVKNHLDWLDEEIRRQTGETVRDEEIIPNLSASNPELPAQPTPELLKELDSYRPDPQGVSQEAKRGCLIVFVIFVVLLLGTLVGIYFWKYRDRPVLMPAALATEVSTESPSTI